MQSADYDLRLGHHIINGAGSNDGSEPGQDDIEGEAHNGEKHAYSWHLLQLVKKLLVLQIDPNHLMLHVLLQFFLVDLDGALSVLLLRHIHILLPLLVVTHFIIILLKK